MFLLQSNYVGAKALKNAPKDVRKKIARQYSLPALLEDNIILAVKIAAENTLKENHGTHGLEYATFQVLITTRPFRVEGKLEEKLEVKIKTVVKH
jgi:hypothetical protein